MVKHFFGVGGGRKGGRGEGAGGGGGVGGGRKGGRSNEGPGTDHVISGPMRGLKRLHPSANINTDGHTYRHTNMATF